MSIDDDNDGLPFLHYYGGCSRWEDWVLESGIHERIL